MTHSEYNDLFGLLSKREMIDWQKEFMGEFDKQYKAVYIVAYSHDVARNWAESIGHRISPHDFSYVSSAEKLRGRKDLIIVFLRGWDRNPNAYDIARECDKMKLMGRAEFKNEQDFTDFN